MLLAPLGERPLVWRTDAAARSYRGYATRYERSRSRRSSTDSPSCGAPGHRDAVLLDDLARIRRPVLLALQPAARLAFALPLERFERKPAARVLAGVGLVAPTEQSLEHALSLPRPVEPTHAACITRDG